MTIEAIREYCLSKSHTTEDMPFDQSVLALRVAGKIFLLTNIDEDPLRINLKCDPEKALRLRDEFEDVIPGYHMNKKHWNTVNCEGELKSSFIKRLIDHSYELIVNSFSKKKRSELFDL